ncbi:MAG: radical SAM protein [Deltaproteobacteria bacterium]|nr:radical SAM protein [Deltaproteobacteria bacterium]
MPAPNLMELAARLTANGLRHQELKRQGKPAQVKALSLETTHHCVARCLMCNIWKTPASQPELSVDDWLGLLGNGLFADLVELDVTGGEPFLKQGIAELFLGVADLSRANLSNLKSVAVTSNGYLTEKILSVVDRVLPALREQGIDLVVVCALDAVGELHDRIRNLDGIFQKVNQTINGLVDLRQSHGNLVIGLKTTILPINVGELEAIAEFADRKGMFTIISPRIITSGRYLNSGMNNDFQFDDEQKKQMKDFFSSEHSRWIFHNQTVIDYLVEGKTRKPCTCGFNYFFVRSNGEVFLCPLIDRSFGNVMDQDVRDIYVSGQAGAFRRKVGDFDECASCTEPGLERYALPLEGFKYLEAMEKMGPEKFSELHEYMGLDKYV